MKLLCLKNNEIDTFYAYNLTLKKYSDDTIRAKKVNFACIKGFYKDNQHNGSMTDDELEEKSRKYLKKVKTNIIDLGYNNRDKFEYFVTFTFDDKQISEEVGEGYSHENAIKCLIKWLDRVRHQNKNMYYILVPEFHRSGRLHFHGLVGNVPNWDLVPAFYPKDYKIENLRGKPIYKNGCPIYNIKNFNYGFTTISEIKNKEKVVSYISKYASKELITLKSKKRYWYSRNLQKPEIELNFIDTSLTDYFKDYDITYNETFSTDNRNIELLNCQLPIIDIGVNQKKED